MPIYEWDIETVDMQYGDIMDHDFHKSYKDCLEAIKLQTGEGKRFDIVLVRDTFSGKDHNLRGRNWAYIVDGKLPEDFENGYKVPVKFHKEVEHTNKLVNIKTHLDNWKHF